MSIGFSSAARNLFLLGSTGAAVVTNFFKTIDQSAGTDGVYLPDEIKYNFVDQKFVLAGSASDSNSKGFGWFEKRDDAGTADWDVRVEATSAGVNTTLRAMELDSNDNLIVVGKTADIPWIAKYSNGGVIDWQSTTNTANVEYYGVTSDSNGNYYACGNTDAQFGQAQAFVEKFDTNGNPGWGKSAFMLGRDVVLSRIAANNRGEVVAVGYLEDDRSDKGYIIKIDTNTGEVLWDRTLEVFTERNGFKHNLFCQDVYIDSNDQIYVVGRIGDGIRIRSFLIKYTAEGNIIWQKETPDEEKIDYFQVKSDGETEQTVVFGRYYDTTANDGRGIISKYSKNGDLVWRRVLYSSDTVNVTNAFGQTGGAGRQQGGYISLDADPSFYYLLFIDTPVIGVAGLPEQYTFGKISSSGNGLGDFQYADGTGEIYNYEILNVQDKIGRISDGSVRQDTSDLITYPFNANKLLFDDLATQVSNKKRQMDGPDSFEYSGSPAIRVADFQELNLLGDTGITSETVSTTVSSIDISGTITNNPKWTSSSGLTGTLQINTSGETSDALLSFVVDAVSGDYVTGSELWNYSFVTVTLTSSFTEVSTDTWQASATASSNPGTDYGLNYFEISTDPLTLYFPYTSSITTTTWGDQSGKSNDGLVNGATWNASGYWEFDGTDDYIQLATNSDLTFAGDFSYETWLWTDVQPASNTIWSLPNGQTFQFTTLNSQQQIIYYSGPTGNQGFGNLPNNTWAHYIITKSGNTITGYLNGVQSWTVTPGGSETHNFSGASIGYRTISPIGFYWDGRIGEVRVYPRALTAAQVFQNYNATKSKYINEAPDTAPKIGPGIVYDSNLLLNYDFGNRATFDKNVTNVRTPFSMVESTAIEITPPPSTSFGNNSMAIGYGRLVVGREYANSGNDEVYIYDYSGNLIDTIAGPNASSAFGSSVAIGSDRIVVGARFGDVVSGGSTYQAGWIKIFDLSGNELAKVNNPDPAYDDYFGYSVAVGGNRIVVGAYGDDDNGSITGSAYLFDLSGNYITKLVPSEINAFDFFGHQVFIFEEKIAIVSLDSGDLQNASVWLYDLDGNFIRQFLIVDPERGDAANRVDDLVIYKDKLIVGDAGGGADYDGRVYVYDLDGNLLKTLSSDNDQRYPAGNLYYEFGNSVSADVDSNIIAIGAWYSENALGSVYFYDDDFNYIGKFTNPNPAPEEYDFYGEVVKVGDGKIVIKATHDNQVSGDAKFRIYSLTYPLPTTVNNLSSSSYTGTIYAGVYNYDGYFTDNGTNFYIGSNINTSLSGGTMEAWIWFDNVNQNQGMFQIGPGAVGPYINFYSPGASQQKMRWEVIGNTGSPYTTILSNTNLSTGQWYHFVGTFDGASTTTLYVNGTQDVQQTNMSNQPTSVNAPVTIGNYAGALDGRIGETRFYNRALSATEVSQNFNATRSKYGV